jgi:hypothetical protein
MIPLSKSLSIIVPQPSSQSLQALRGCPQTMETSLKIFFMERSLIMLNKKKLFTNLFTNLIQNNTGSVYKSWKWPKIYENWLLSSIRMCMINQISLKIWAKFWSHKTTFNIFLAPNKTGSSKISAFHNLWTLPALFWITLVNRLLNKNFQFIITKNLSIKNIFKDVSIVCGQPLKA